MTSIRGLEIWRDAIHVRIECHTQDGERRRTVFFGDMGGLQWFRREEIHEDGQWVRHSHVQVTAPTLDVVPIGASTASAGP